MINPGVFFVPANDGTSREQVWHRKPGGASDEYLGDVSETAGAGWLAEFYKGHDRNAEKIIGVPGFVSKEWAADFLFTYEPSIVSSRRDAHLKPIDTWVNGTIVFRGETAEAAVTAIGRAADALLDGAASWTDTTNTTYDVKLTVN
ncbi:hypothetical protein [Streptomyces sp. NPDC088141]|uniref:hypothetical protein n=1 Tax=unclassified Streptomyces TaxID=2593676 RepID=UPI0034495562